MAENLNDEALRREVRAELSRVEEDATYTSKAHFEAADRWSGVHLWVGIASALMAALAGASAWKNQPEIASTLALISGALTALLTFLNPQSRHAAHQQAGARFVALRNEARLMRQVELLATASAALPDLVTRLKDLSKRYSDANAASPLIPRHAYQSAARGIRQGQARHAVDSPPAASVSAS
ncbi:hypothetical protein X805_35730 [Sphaerotilus natans subsp. natans DSM 6575]|uniref:SLATT domain-containing protein n=1 Tax=Sphaerotilus natans subsp. natans DSM 6575 TaxID=1286631 RepID=A0A059KHW6_9BURK|nr:SLATT domain-containing protein [Sphaerotilus natans]KDB50829.1 hypothetical protein X805_35730 [Sphaerotilus natans subsp. natans DSM 6575]SIR98175.1 hypothetical protein SAMN05421778_12534 [Sphaerotilus natans]